MVPNRRHRIEKPVAPLETVSYFASYGQKRIVVCSSRSRVCMTIGTSWRDGGDV
jgi:hypothetical protein